MCERAREKGKKPLRKVERAEREHKAKDHGKVDTKSVARTPAKIIQRNTSLQRLYTASFSQIFVFIVFKVFYVATVRAIGLSLSQAH